MDNRENFTQSDDIDFDAENYSSPYTEDIDDGEESLGEEYKQFSYRSIATTASSIGISSLSEEVCQHIAEELYYKTKELIYTSKLILNQNKSSKLTTNDVKKAMKLLGGVEIYGHSSSDEVNFVHIPECGVYVEEDPEIEFEEEHVPDCDYIVKKDPYLSMEKGGWVMPEGYSEDLSIMTTCPYYQKIAKTILNGSPAHLRVALSDLRTNPKIGPICPYFLNLVALIVKKVPRDIHLTNALIGTVHAIVHNKYIDLSPHLAANRVVNSLLKIVIEGNVKKINEEYVDNDDDLTVRMRAGILLAKVILMWSIELKQQVGIVRLLLQHLVNPAVPLQSHYGAIVALTTLRHKRLNYFWPIVEKILTLLEVKINSKKNDIMVRHVMTAILVAARNAYKKEQGSNPEQLKQLYKVDKMLYSSFGDSVTPLQLVACPPIFKCEASQVVPSHLKLQIRWTKTSNFKDRILAQTEEIIDKARSEVMEGDFLSTCVEEPMQTVSANVPYYCVKRNYKFCRPLHERSASGDLLLLL